MKNRYTIEEIMKENDRRRMWWIDENIIMYDVGLQETAEIIWIARIKNPISLRRGS